MGNEMVKRIQNTAIELSENLSLRDTVLGYSYNAVIVEDGGMGVAFSFRGSGRSDNNKLSYKDTHSAISQLTSNDLLRSSISLATINALFNREDNDLLPGNMLEHIRINKDDSVGMVGYFRPIMSRLKEMTDRIFVFERVQKREGEILPEQKAYSILKECDVAIISSTTIINHTIDRLLESVISCREVVLLGASTPILPQAFKDTPVTLLSGIVVNNPTGVMKAVVEGGGVRAFNKYVTKVNLFL